MNDKFMKSFLIILFAICLIAGGVGLYYHMNNTTSDEKTTNNESNDNTSDNGDIVDNNEYQKCGEETEYAIKLKNPLNNYSDLKFVKQLKYEDIKIKDNEVTFIDYDENEIKVNGIDSPVSVLSSGQKYFILNKDGNVYYFYTDNVDEKNKVVSAKKYNISNVIGIDVSFVGSFAEGRDYSNLVIKTKDGNMYTDLSDYYSEDESLLINTKYMDYEYVDPFSNIGAIYGTYNMTKRYVYDYEDKKYCYYDYEFLTYNGEVPLITEYFDGDIVIPKEEEIVDYLTVPYLVTDKGELLKTQTNSTKLIKHNDKTVKSVVDNDDYSYLVTYTDGTKELFDAVKKYNNENY